MKGYAIIYSSDELAFIKANSKLPRRELTHLFNTTFNRDLKVSYLDALCKRTGWLTGRTGKFKKGMKSWNKGKKGYMSANRTSFKKGQMAHNHKPVGSTRINVEGYVENKVEEPKKWIGLHRKVWLETHGKIPKNHVIAFKNGDKTDCRIDNLMLLSRSELSVINHNFSQISNDYFETKSILGKIITKASKQ
ncbi:MAG: HNH endonuclease signature motif containing protein [Paracoccus sp. (in: a-proteobacteria)]